jgi:hypothetical protein
MKIVYLGQEVPTDQPFFAHLRDNAELLTCMPQKGMVESVLGSQKINAVIGLENQLDMMKSIIRQFPLSNYALMSSLATDDFHEVTEGYGFFMQLPLSPSQKDAEHFFQLLEAITFGPKVPARRAKAS